MKRIDLTKTVFNIAPDAPRPRVTRWQRLVAWFLDRPLSVPWLLRRETWVRERLGRRVRSCVLVQREADHRLAAFTHEVGDMVKRADVLTKDELRYIGFVPQSPESKGKWVEVRLPDGSTEHAVVVAVGIDTVIV